MDDLNGRTPSSAISRLRKHFSQDVTQSWGDSILIILCFVTGLVDGAVFNNWSCFVSMQTGMSILTYVVTKEDIDDGARKYNLHRARRIRTAYQRAMAMGQSLDVYRELHARRSRHPPRRSRIVSPSAEYCMRMLPRPIITLLDQRSTRTERLRPRKCGHDPARQFYRVATTSPTVFPGSWTGRHVEGSGVQRGADCCPNDELCGSHVRHAAVHCAAQGKLEEE